MANDCVEWSINVRCEPQAVAALDGAISAAYPDVRLGRAHGEQPRPRPGVLREPLHQHPQPLPARLPRLIEHVQSDVCEQR